MLVWFPCIGSARRCLIVIIVEAMHVAQVSFNLELFLIFNCSPRRGFQNYL
jgi:hypothetical protein